MFDFLPVRSRLSLFFGSSGLSYLLWRQLFTIPILLVLLLLAKLWTLYAIPYFSSLEEDDIIQHDLILEAIQADVHTWHVFALCLAIALLIGLPLEMKFGKFRSRAYQQLRRFTMMNNKSTMAVLSVAKARHGYLTAADLAAQSELMTLGRANKILTELQKRGYIDLSVAASDEILYYFPGFDHSHSLDDHSTNERAYLIYLRTDCDCLESVT